MCADALKLSILVPVFNAALTLPRTLNSLLAIAPSNRAIVQVIVINDGSTDDGLNIVRKFAQEVPEFQWEIIDQPNAGVSVARNAGFARIRAEWIFLLDADDELAIDLVPLIAASGDASSLLFGQEFRGPGNRVRRRTPPIITLDNRADRLTAECPFQPSGIVFRRSCIEHLFESDIRYTEDWLFWNSNPRIFDKSKTLRSIVASIVYIHGRNASTNYVGWGHDREIVARKILEMHGERLTRKQKNNLNLQQQIGRLQQRQCISLLTFLRFPCNSKLYLKLWVYFLAAIFGIRASYYRPLPPPRQS